MKLKNLFYPRINARAYRRFPELEYFDSDDERRKMMKELPGSTVWLILAVIPYAVLIIFLKELQPFGFARAWLPVEIFELIEPLTNVILWVTAILLIQKSLQTRHQLYLRHVLRKKGVFLCHDCGYNLRGLDGFRCPECGLVKTPPINSSSPE